MPRWIKPSVQVSQSIIRAFATLELMGAAGMTLIFATALLSPQVKRCSTWYTFCVSWIVSCLSYSLLFFRNHFKLNGSLLDSDGGVEGVCVAQAALVYSVPTLYI